MVHKLLECCQKYVVAKQSNLTHWHLILGWFSQTPDLTPGLHEALPLVKRQLSYLWSPDLIVILFTPVVESVSSVNRKSDSQSSSRRGSVTMGLEAKETASGLNSTSTNTTSMMFKKAMDRAASALGKAATEYNPMTATVNVISSSASAAVSLTSTKRYLASPDVQNVSMICCMFTAAINTLTQVKMEILAGLCYQEMVPINLWKFISSLGPKNGLNSFVDHLTLNTKSCAPEFQMLILFCDCATHLIT